MNAIIAYNATDWMPHWHKIKDHLKRACDKSGGRHTVDSTAWKLERGEYVLLTAMDGENIKSACVCGISSYPASDWLTIILCGGDGMVDWLPDGQAALEDLAKLNKCAGIEVLGRRGWARALNLRTMGVWMERRL